MRSCFYLVLPLILCLLGGCSSSSEESERPVTTAADAQETNQRDEVLATLASLDPSAMQQAFAHLSDFAFTTRTRIEQRDEQSRILATTATTARYIGTDSMQVLHTNSTGRFAFGWLARFAQDSTTLVDFASLPAHILPDDPPYLSPRNRDAYAYVFLPDTVLAGHPARVLEVHIRPDSDQEQTIQRGRFYLNPEDDTLLALELERVEQGLLFREESTYAITLRPAPDSNGWLPATTRADVHLHAPLRPAEQFYTSRTFSDFAPVQ